MQHIATLQAADRNWMLDQHQTWWNLYRQDRELQLTVIPDEVHNPELRSPTTEFVKTIAVDVSECSESLAGCGDALSDVSLGLAGVAWSCTQMGAMPCAAAASVAGTATGIVGTGITAYNAIIEPTTANIVDTGISATTTYAGTRPFASRGNGAVGFGISFFQWLWDQRD